MLGSLPPLISASLRLLAGSQGVVSRSSAAATHLVSAAKRIRGLVMAPVMLPRGEGPPLLPALGCMQLRALEGAARQLTGLEAEGLSWCRRSLMGPFSLTSAQVGVL
jgi:hypothetical protein